MNAAEKEKRAAEREQRRKEKLDAYIERLVDEWPPLTNEQRDKLAILLRGSA